MCLWYNRGNLKQAVADNLLDDLGLTTNDYNTGETMATSLRMCICIDSV
jgi:hypothetical protein